MGLELIEITVTKYLAGETLTPGEHDLWLTNFEDISNPVKYKEPKNVSERALNNFQGINKDLVKFTEDGWGFNFTFVGNNRKGEWVGGIDFETDQMGYSDVFTPYLNDILKLFDFEENERRVRLVTVWQYNSYHYQATSYSGEEWDNEWNIIGVLNIKETEISFKISELDNCSKK